MLFTRAEFKALVYNGGNMLAWLFAMQYITCCVSGTGNTDKAN